MSSAKGASQGISMDGGYASGLTAQLVAIVLARNRAFPATRPRRCPGRPPGACRAHPSVPPKLRPARQAPRVDPHGASVGRPGRHPRHHDGEPPSLCRSGQRGDPWTPRPAAHAPIRLVVWRLPPDPGQLVATQGDTAGHRVLPRSRDRTPQRIVGPAGALPAGVRPAAGAERDRPGAVAVRRAGRQQALAVSPAARSGQRLSPVPPSWWSGPGPPARVSSPGPPESTSEPSPPASLSLPVPP
jgi:hypothetical protein